MQTVSASVRALVDAYAKITLKIYIDGTALDAGIGLCSYTPSCGDPEAFSVGNACSAGLSMRLDGAHPSLKDKSIAVKWSVGDTEYPLLTGTVEKATVSASSTTVEAYDYMYRRGALPFAATETLLAACTAGDVLRQVAEYMSVDLDETILGAADAVTIPDGLVSLTGEETCSEVAGYAAGIMGGNALISREGLLTVRGYVGTDFSTEPYSGGAEAENEDFSFTGVTFRKPVESYEYNEDGTSTATEGTAEYSAGDGSLLLENLLACQDGADAAYAALFGVSFRPGTYSFPGGLLLEPGDIFTVKSMDGTYQVAATSLTMSLDGGCMTSAVCGGAPETGGAVGPINQAMAALEVAFARFKKLYADNAEIVSANIETLKAGKIFSQLLALLPKETTGEETTLGRLVLYGYDGDGGLMEKMALEVYPYQPSNATPAVIRVPTGLEIYQEDTLLATFDANMLNAYSNLRATNGLGVYSDPEDSSRDLLIFDKSNNQTRISATAADFAGEVSAVTGFRVPGDAEDAVLGPTTNLVPETYYGGTRLDARFAAFPGNSAGSHNAIYRGKNLGGNITIAQQEAIEAGTFDDLYIGDYWTINDVNWRIAAFDYYYNTGDTACTTHHVVIVPDTRLYTTRMNSTDTTKGAYVGSEMYTSGLEDAKEIIKAAFGNMLSILTHRQYLANATTDGYASGGDHYDSTVELMTEQNVLGCALYGNRKNGTNTVVAATYDNCQFPLFALNPSMKCNRQGYWFRDVATSNSFAYMAYTGRPNYYGASNTTGVRPSFSVCADAVG